MADMAGRAWVAQGRGGQRGWPGKSSLYPRVTKRIRARIHGLEQHVGTDMRNRMTKGCPVEDVLAEIFDLIA